MKKLVKVPVNEVGSIPHDFIGKFGSAEVLLKASPEGTGIIAGGPSRAVLELAGYKNIRSKALGSNNKQNVVLATIAGLKDKLKITLVKSPIGAIPKQRATVEALGLKKVNKTVEMPDNDAVRGMIWHVRHLVKVEEI